MRSKEDRTTDTTRFLVRGLNLERRSLEKQGFINAFIDDATHEPHHVRSVYLLFKPKSLEVFEEFVQEQRFQTALLVEDYDYPGGYVVIVYNFPALYWSDYQHFLKGEYSKFSKGYKSLFPKERKRESSKGIPYTEPSFYAHVFGRTQEMKDYWEEKLSVYLSDDSEYWSIIDKNKETLNIKNYEQVTLS